jgi:hypothetical protein
MSVATTFIVVAGIMFGLSDGCNGAHQWHARHPAEVRTIAQQALLRTSEPRHWPKRKQRA